MTLVGDGAYDVNVLDCNSQRWLKIKKNLGALNLEDPVRGSASLSHGGVYKLRTCDANWKCTETGHYFSDLLLDEAYKQQWDIPVDFAAQEVIDDARCALAFAMTSALVKQPTTKEWSIGLGVGIGIGVPILIASIIAGIYWRQELAAFFARISPHAAHQAALAAASVASNHGASMRAAASATAGH
jgi:hypothetical protein